MSPAVVVEIRPGPADEAQLTAWQKLWAELLRDVPTLAGQAELIRPQKGNCAREASPGAAKKTSLRRQYPHDNQP
jgi:hypothetical protein